MARVVVFVGAAEVVDYGTMAAPSLVVPDGAMPPLEIEGSDILG